MNSIETSELTKKFDGITAVDGLSIQVKEGEVFGILGPNGAGKTTTLSMLCTILKPTSGTATVNGFDIIDRPHDVRRSIGIVFQDPSLDNRLTGSDNLHIHAALYGVDDRIAEERIEKLVKLVGLEDRINHLVKTYSGGMRRRLEIARGLVHTPRVLFLDEPTLGLDPQTRSKVWEYIDSVRKSERITVVLTTHYMEEAESLCDRVAIVDNGRIAALDSPHELTKKTGSEVVTLTMADSSRAGEFKTIPTVTNVKSPSEGVVMLSVQDSAAAVPKIMRRALELGMEVKTLDVQKVTLNEVFMHYVGREIREEEGKHSAKEMMKHRLQASGRI
ncbi:MAG: ATP-binding cassette domain-containing protein [Candidatus Altiarchaeota archaeon]|nr:ATP-binding cassette domain-containing protein [Candidatus Altiarchaeota archaeon]